jgi:hypothetical protein
MKKTNTDSPSNRGVEPEGSRKSGVGICPSDEEIICTWMETRPKYVSQGQPGWIEDDQWNAHHRWWKWFVDKDWQHLPVDLDLDALWEVEERLTGEQWGEYSGLLMDPRGVNHTRFLLHATAEQKTKALAAVLRSWLDHNS